MRVEEQTLQKSARGAGRGKELATPWRRHGDATHTHARGKYVCVTAHSRARTAYLLNFPAFCWGRAMSVCVFASVCLCACVHVCVRVSTFQAPDRNVRIAATSSEHIPGRSLGGRVSPRPPRARVLLFRIPDASLPKAPCSDKLSLGAGRPLVGPAKALCPAAPWVACSAAVSRPFCVWTHRTAD